MFDQIPATVFMAAGTIAAAIISGSIAFLNLLTTKEQAVSEFRQRWIDSLREELSQFLSAANSISVHTQIALEREAKEGANLVRDMEPLHPHIEICYTMYTRIVLRLNPEEHRSIRKQIDMVEASLSHPEIIGDPEVFEPIYEKLASEAQTLLKSEWNRVKKGEITYRAIKVISGGVFISALCAAIFFVSTVPFI